jgi:hypothetical protein
MNPIVVALALVQLTGPTGWRIDLNADAITSIRDPSAMPDGHWSKQTHCLVAVDGGAPIAVLETCDEVRQRIAKGAKP